jgi:hypothetical protein
MFGVAGASALAVEWRLAALAPGGVAIGTLHYNPFSGWLALTDVRARDAAGREIFRADSVLATANPLSVVAGTLSLGRVRVAGPRVTLRAGGSFDLEDVAAGFGAAHVFFGAKGRLALPLSVDDLVVGDGSVIVEGAGERGAPLVVRDLDVRLSRLTTAALGERDVAFALEMVVYGTAVHMTGQPRGDGYAVRVRARGLDAAAFARDFPVAALDALQRGKAEIDGEIVLSQGRALASGSVRVSDVELALPLAGRPRVRAAAIAVAADAFDLASRTGRITRLDVVAPTLALPAPRAIAALGELLAPLRDDRDLVLRRVSITDGTLAVGGPGGIRLARLQLAAQLPERRTDSGWVVSARATLGDDAEVSIDGIVARDLRGLDAVTRLSRVPLATWQAAGGAALKWDARVSFDGRLRLVTSEGETLATATGQAELSDVSGGAAGGFRAERVALGIRRLRWPAADAVFDRVVITRPAFGPGALGPWLSSQVMSGMTVVDGEVRGNAPGRALHRLAVDLAPDDAAGLARLKLSASTDSGARVNLDRVVPYAATDRGLPLGLLAATLDEAARSASIAPSALPAFLP